MSEPAGTQEQLSPRPLMRILGDFANSQILDAALEYDFFSPIHKGFQSAEEIACAAGTDLRRTRIVLDRPPALAVAESGDGSHSLTTQAATLSVKGQPTYIAHVT